jgi:nucleoside-diphosphate-sugar epimerase
MRIFVTGASGFIGTAVVDALQHAGHEVVGLAQSPASAQRLRASGATVQLGSLADLDTLHAVAAASDGVVHLAFCRGDPPEDATIAGTDAPASSAATRSLLGSEPSHPGLLEDLEHGAFFEGGAG